tara:strand:+ start:1848 stop:2603 length:756 start_codon:yes stop_codon:yes gene_type:complete
MPIDYDDPAVIQDAKDKLAEMYSRADRKQRIAIGRGLGYDKARRNPDSARRSAERLATFRIGKGSKLNVTKYFRDIVYSDEDVPPWDGNLPVLTAERGETYYITAYSAFQRGEGGAFDGFITPDFHAPYNDIRSLFQGINDVVDAIFRNEPQNDAFPGTNRNDYLGIVAIALSEAGVREMEQDTGPITKREDGIFGVTLLSSSVRFTKTKLKKDRKAIARSRASSREFPVRRRKEIIQYIRRSYAQRSRAY